MPTQEGGQYMIQGGPKRPSVDKEPATAPAPKGAPMDAAGGADGNYQNAKQMVSKTSHPLPGTYMTPPPAEHGVVKASGPTGIQISN